MVKKWPNNDKIVLEKQKIFTKALAKINWKITKEFAMNEVRYHCQSRFNLSYQRCSCCVNHASIFEISIKKLNAFGRFLSFFYQNLCYIQNLKTPYFP